MSRCALPFFEAEAKKRQGRKTSSPIGEEDRRDHLAAEDAAKAFDTSALFRDMPGERDGQRGQPCERERRQRDREHEQHSSHETRSAHETGLS